MIYTDRQRNDILWRLVQIMELIATDVFQNPVSSQCLIKYGAVEELLRILYAGEGSRSRR